jgi:solute:Na+ symporter, SSS family
LGNSAFLFSFNTFGKLFQHPNFQFMGLATLDYLIIILFVIIILGVGLSFKNIAGKSIQNFFLGGRNLSWWVAGTSMVATTFAADTPLAVTELVAKNGIAGNWLWWNMMAGGMLTVFFFAKYWRRANILTDVELIELRYSGKAASFLRGFRAVYMGVFMNAMIIGWVNVALYALLKVFFGVPDDQMIYYIGAAMVLVFLYSSVSGLLGVVFTDVIQFVIAMTGTIILSILVVQSDKIGGIAGLKSHLPEWSMSYFPKIGTGTGTDTASTLALSVGSFLAFIGIQWWASWYPGNEPGGGGYIAQRMMSAKDEKNAIGATMFFQIAHYCIRPWPWILVALCALILYPDLQGDDIKLGYVMAMKDFLPVGLKGLLLVAFFAAYMSTVSTQLNWGTSYLVNDLYKRFINPDGSEKQYVLVSRLGTGFLMLVALYATTQITNISGVWQFLMECGAGLGLVLILRWYWWRVNAWSEIVATIAPFIAYALARYEFDWVFPQSFFFTVGFTTVAWIAATLLTPPTDRQKLEEFYQLIKPFGQWRPFQDQQAINKSKRSVWLLLGCWLSAIFMAYSILFLTGKIIFMEWTEAGIYLAVFLLSFFSLRYLTNKVKIFEL